MTGRYLFILLLQSWLLVEISANANGTEDRFSSMVAIIRRDLNFTQLVEFDGYVSETHTVTTEDGYILTIFRIPPRCSLDAEPIVFMHGLFLSGDDCVVPGPGRAHCYIYASACRDVWVPNVRGTLYSRKHTTLNPDTDPEFWDFTFDDMAKYDTPAIIDYILQQTGKEQLVWVSHAQGATMLFNLVAAQPEYNAKIKVGFGLSATAWLEHCKFIVIQLAGLFSKLPLNNELNVEFVPRGGFYQPLLKALCGTTDISYPGCSAIYFALLGFNHFQIEPDTFKTLMGHLPSGTSLKNYYRWGQIYANGFTHYDYGLLKNLLVYRQASPPEFDLSQVSMKWLFIGSENDYVSAISDLDVLISKLQDASKCVLSDKSFGHLDYVFGRAVSTLITPIILNYLNTGEFECL